MAGSPLQGGSRRRVTAVAALAIALSVALPAGTARAGNDLVGGIGDIIGGALAIPMSTLAGTFTGPPILGTIGGALSGVFGAISLTARGLLRLVGVSVPIATTVAPYLPLFL